MNYLTDLFANIPRNAYEQQKQNAIAPSTSSNEGEGDRGSGRIVITCPECGGWQVPENIQGAQVTCDSCGHQWCDRALLAG